MLIDVSVEASKIKSLVLGVGINFQIEQTPLEKSLKNTENFYGVTSLVGKSNSINPVLLVKSFLYELENIFELLEKGKKKVIIKNWTKKSSTIGKNIVASSSDGMIKGKAVKLDADGALVIYSKKKYQRVIAGDLNYSTN